MLRIGITGGIGSGKTTVCRIFEVLGIPVFYADSAAKAVMHTDASLRAEIIEQFGEKSYSDLGELDRKHISSIVFSDDRQLARLNAIVHPAVFRAFDAWVYQQDAPYVLKEAALLFESGSYKMCDQTVLVESPEMLRIERIMERDHVTEDQVRSRMSKQLSDGEKEKLADHILMNDEQTLLIPQVLSLHNYFLAIANDN
ncbi:MAG: dephospho-CoA kinase [Daejeonella sp.]|uniref:dephospho-CoA kinase n=1 Tax=Daejeonella sp. JGW-45 TaxID=3034148 RepID=UPI0023EC6508|nr:dephospho-CoA kinase [Daejeonella sp. JGW-45]